MDQEGAVHGAEKGDHGLDVRPCGAVITGGWALQIVEAQAQLVRRVPPEIDSSASAGPPGRSGWSRRLREGGSSGSSGDRRFAHQRRRDGPSQIRRGRRAQRMATFAFVEFYRPARGQSADEIDRALGIVPRRHDHHAGGGQGAARIDGAPESPRPGSDEPDVASAPVTEYGRDEEHRPDERARAVEERLQDQPGPERPPEHVRAVGFRGRQQGRHVCDLRGEVEAGELLVEVDPREI